MSSILAAALIVPYDPSMDTPLGHRNLVVIYVVVAFVQIAYAAYVLHAWRASGRARKKL